MSNSQVTACALALACSLACAQSLQAQCACGAAGMAMMPPGMLPMLPGADPLAGAQPGMIIEPNAIYLTVKVPEKTILMINGDPTISQGETRYFVVRGLEPDREYKFEIVAETVNPAGVEMLEKKALVLKTGAIETVALKPTKRKRDVLLVEEQQKKDEAAAAKVAGRTPRLDG